MQFSPYLAVIVGLVVLAGVALYFGWGLVSGGANPVGAPFVLSNIAGDAFLSFNSDGSASLVGDATAATALTLDPTIPSIASTAGPAMTSPFAIRDAAQTGYLTYSPSTQTWGISAAGAPGSAIFDKTGGSNGAIRLGNSVLASPKQSAGQVPFVYPAHSDYMGTQDEWQIVMIKN